MSTALASTHRIQGLKPAGLDLGPLADRLAHVRHLASSKSTSVAAAGEYAQAMLGFQVYANHLYRTLHTDQHRGHGSEERAHD